MFRQLSLHDLNWLMIPPRRIFALIFLTLASRYHRGDARRYPLNIFFEFGAKCQLIDLMTTARMLTSEFEDSDF